MENLSMPAKNPRNFYYLEVLRSKSQEFETDLTKASQTIPLTRCTTPGIPKTLRRSLPESQASITAQLKPAAEPTPIYQAGRNDRNNRWTGGRFRGTSAHLTRI